MATRFMQLLAACIAICCCALLFIVGLFHSELSEHGLALMVAAVAAFQLFVMVIQLWLMEEDRRLFLRRLNLECLCDVVSSHMKFYTEATTKTIAAMLPRCIFKAFSLLIPSVSETLNAHRVPVQWYLSGLCTALR
jgi:hypothetical protein